MNLEKNKQELLPWSNGDFEALLLDLVAHGTELAKVDFKTEIEAKTSEQKADLLKDIIAIANTYDFENYEDYGFIVYGVKAKTIVGITTTESDIDKFQNHIDQLLKNYISPMPQVYVIGFKDKDGKLWGVIVIPPRNSKPHMFFKELSCQYDKSRTRKKGEWFIRKGTTTDPGLPEDLAVITQRQMEIVLEPLKESIRSLQVRIGKTEEQYSSALFKIVERALSSFAEPVQGSAGEGKDVDSGLSMALGMDLPTRLKRKLRTPKDAIVEDLIEEAKSLQDLVTGADTGISWAPQLNQAAENRQLIEKLEGATKTLQISVAVILLNDNKGVYTDALLRIIKLLSRIVDVPSGVAFNRIGTAIRYYPLGLLIYTIFVCGVAADRSDILKKIVDIPVKGFRKDTAAHITDIFFFWYEAKALLNDAFAQRQCEPMGLRVRQVISDHVGEMISEYLESEYFFRGEFVLALIRIDWLIGNGEYVDRRFPAPGLYLYLREAYDVIHEFLLDPPMWFDDFYHQPVKDILGAFDQNADKMVSQNCFGVGFRGLKAVEIYKTLSRKR